MMRLVSLIILALSILVVAPGHAVAAPQPDEQMEDEALEVRARGLYRDLRCVVCQSQSIDESNAPLAADMRAIVRERLLAGDSDAEVRAWLQTRYGDYVLMSPPVQGNTLLLWLFPLLALSGGAIAIVIFFRGQSARADGPLDADEAAELARLRDEEGQA
ncbi:cytochrome c-type biogenesis protein CcmH [Maricaulis maris]|jgi:cytochrome c-type biogenesis protein CcmH|uniref:cytochrome c-type biogenesis protein n=1 Tax=Maricaulis maris TaxID=74318 RepID=UPI0026EA15FE|nr:cytochrome c-type biogenesis protein CcmH [Maricaulis maris]